MSALESSMIWPPVEAMTQVTRNCQKLIAKDMASLATQVKALAAAMPKAETGSTAVPLKPDQLPAKTKLQLVKSLQSMLKEAQTLKRKLEESSQASTKHARLCSHRLHYLKHAEQLAAENRQGGGATEYESFEEEDSSPPPHDDLNTLASRHNNCDMLADKTKESTLASSASHTAASASKADEAESTFPVTPRLRLDRMFADHLLRNNRPSTAALLISSSPGLASLVDPEIFVAARKIEHSLRVQHDCTKALAWCGENRSRLNKIASPLEFDLRLQEFLTLVQKKRTIDAIEYARKHLAPAAITVAPAAAAPPAVVTSDTTKAVRNNDEKKDDAATDAPPPPMVVDQARLQTLQEVMNLLIFDGFDEASTDEAAPNGSSTNRSSAWQKYHVYWSPRRFEELVRSFHATHLAIHGLPSRSAMEYALLLGLATIKTSACEQPEESKAASRPSTDDAAAMLDVIDDDQTPSTSAAADSRTPPLAPPPSCPACVSPLRHLARSLPVAPRSHSRLVCRLSGAVMDDRNPPLVLPNGYVYSQAALTAMADLDPQGRVTCPQTNQQFTLTQAKRAFVL